MKIFSKLKQAILNLPGNKLVRKYFVWVIILDFLASILPTFSSDGIQVIKAIYVTRNIPWPPQLNSFNLGLLSNVMIMLLIEFVVLVILTFLLLVTFSFVINKIFNLFKKDVGFLKLCNISLLCDLIVYSFSVVGLIMYIIFSYLFPFYRGVSERNFILEPIFLIWQLLAFLLDWGGWIVGLIVLIYGIKISLKEYKPKIKQKI